MRAALVLALTLGYVMPGYSILRRLADNRDELGLNALKVQGSASVAPGSAREVAQLLGTSWETGELPVSFTVTMKVPGRCRAELATLDGAKKVAAAQTFGKKRSEGGAVPALTTAVDAMCGLLALRGAGEGESRAALEKYLGKLGVNTKATSLGRFGGNIVFIIGEAQGAQLWVHRERFLPVRLKLLDETKTPWDVQFLDYTSSATGEWFPRALAVSKGQEPILKLNAQTSDLRPKLDDQSF